VPNVFCKNCFLKNNDLSDHNVHENLLEKVYKILKNTERKMEATHNPLSVLTFCCVYLVSFPDESHIHTYDHTPIYCNLLIFEFYTLIIQRIPL
jgi:hypothetical protein